jgi:hypothetical protein
MCKNFVGKFFPLLFVNKSTKTGTRGFQASRASLSHWSHFHIGSASFAPISSPMSKRVKTSHVRLLSDCIVQPLNDRRLYRLVELPNRLRVLLISDPEIAKKSTEAESGQTTDNNEDEADEADTDNENEGDELSVSAPEKKASCAMCVGVGSLSDPMHTQGLAHFTGLPPLDYILHTTITATTSTTMTSTSLRAHAVHGDEKVS